MSTLPVPHLDRDSMRMRDRLVDIKMDDYQEPYQALRYAPYYSYSTVVMEMQDMLPPSNQHSGKSEFEILIFIHFILLIVKIKQVKTMIDFILYHLDMHKPKKVGSNFLRQSIDFDMLVHRSIGKTLH